MAGIGRLSDLSVLPLPTYDPSAAFEDLEPLAGLISDDVRVVAVGESAHGAHEYYALRHGIIRFLIERMNFTAVAWESGFPEGFLVDDYIQGEQHDLHRVQVDGMTMHMGRCQEMADLLDWLRAHNEADSHDSDSKRVRFYGSDLPATGSSLAAVIETVGAYVEVVDTGFQTRFKRLRELATGFGPGETAGDSARVVLSGTTALYQYTAMSAADRNELTGLLADLSARFDALRRVYVERSDLERYENMRQQLHVAARLDVQLRAVAAFMAGDTAACEANIRDATMADTVEWILGRHERVILLAHNGHIQRMPIATPMGPIDTLGVHLAHRLGDRYLVIGTTCGGGDIIVPRTSTEDGAQVTELIIRDLPPAGEDVIDSVLDASIEGTALLDLRTLDAANAAVIDAAPRMRMIDQFTDIDVRKSFDMLIHVPRISLWKSTLNAALPDTRAGESS